MWSKFFKSQAYNIPVWKHEKYHIYETMEYDFYRCVEFKKEFYGKTASELFNGNLRECTGRYSKLFPDHKISYWADSAETAIAEIKKHGAGCDIITFWAYDDMSSFRPCMGNDEMLRIVDGRECGIQEIIDKVENSEDLSTEEKKLIDGILAEPIDGIAYDSKARKGGENFIFLESGFKKLALRELRLRFGRRNGGAHNYICCADTSDYVPWLKNYGQCFLPKCRIGMNEDYLKSSEYLNRVNNMKERRE